jgi:hypothetical protein
MRQELETRLAVPVLLATDRSCHPRGAEHQWDEANAGAREVMHSSTPCPDSGRFSMEQKKAVNCGNVWVGQSGAEARSQYFRVRATWGSISLDNEPSDCVLQ